MKFEIHVYVHEFDSVTAHQLAQLDRKLTYLIEETILMTKTEAARLDTLTNAIKARFEALLSRIPEPLTPTEQAAVDADFATLETLGKDPEAPIPAA